MGRTRVPAVAGLFYPADAARLTFDLRSYMAACAEARSSPGPKPVKALIVPHAGYAYSAPIAASAYTAVRGRAAEIRRVVLLGPAHRVFVRGLAVPDCEAFATPLGAVAIDRTAVSSALELPAVVIDDEAHRQEHSLEVQLPFLQRLLSDWALVPFAVGEASISEVAAVLERSWGGPETLIVISSDLSHYHDYASAMRLDTATAAAIEHLDPEAIERDSACGAVPIRGLLAVARKRGLQAHLLDLRNSGDTAGNRDEVVGYGAFVFA